MKGCAEGKLLGQGPGQRPGRAKFFPDPASRTRAAMNLAEPATTPTPNSSKTVAISTMGVPWMAFKRLRERGLGRLVCQLLQEDFKLLLGLSIALPVALLEGGLAILVGGEGGLAALQGVGGFLGVSG